MRDRKSQRSGQLLGLALLLLSASNAAGQGTDAPEARLKALGIELPPAPQPLASYVPAVRTGDLVFLAGQGPLANGKPTVTGKVGAQLTEQEGYDAARATILTSLAVLRAEIGSLDRVATTRGSIRARVSCPLPFPATLSIRLSPAREGGNES